MPHRSAYVRQRVVGAHLVHSVVGRLPPTRLADDRRRVRCVRVENPGIMRPEENVIDPKC